MDPREDPTDSLSAWSPEHPLDIFPVRESLLNHSFVRDLHRQRQLCGPNVRLEFPTLGRSRQRLNEITFLQPFSNHPILPSSSHIYSQLVVE